MLHNMILLGRGSLKRADVCLMETVPAKIVWVGGVGHLTGEYQ